MSQFPLSLSFNVELKREMGDILGRRYRDFLRKVTISTFTRIIFRTPVDRGIARGNWLITSADTTAWDIDIRDRGGQATISKGTAAFNGFAKNITTIYILSNVPYIIPLEHGWSQQTAAHVMVARSVMEARGMTA